MITVTEKAAQKALLLAEKEGKPKVLRIGVKGGGCSGVSYFMDFDDSLREGDASIEVAGLKVVVDPKSLSFLEGTVLDYSTNLMSHGFRFSNPSAKKTCSCGESFAI